MSILGFVILFFALIVIGATQAAATLGVMYGMHKKIPEKLKETHYLEFDFDNFQKGPFQEMVTRLAVIFLGVTLVLHMLVYTLVSKKFIVYHRPLLCLILWVLESGLICAGLFFLLKLDKFRLIALTAAGSFFYLILILYLTSGNLLYG